MARKTLHEVPLEALDLVQGGMKLASIGAHVPLANANVFNGGGLPAVTPNAPLATAHPTALLTQPAIGQQTLDPRLLAALLGVGANHPVQPAVQPASPNPLNTLLPAIAGLFKGMTSHGAPSSGARRGGSRGRDDDDDNHSRARRGGSHRDARGSRDRGGRRAGSRDRSRGRRDRGGRDGGRRGGVRRDGGVRGPGRETRDKDPLQQWETRDKEQWGGQLGGRPTDGWATGSVDRVQTGSVDRVQTGSVDRVQTGSVDRTQAGSVDGPTYDSGSVERSVGNTYDAGSGTVDSGQSYASASPEASAPEAPAQVAEAPQSEAPSEAA